MIKVALFGCGRMGMHHVKAVSIQENAELVAVADPVANLTELQQKLGDKIKIFNNPTQLLEEIKPDVVHVVTPPETHVELAKLALESGAHVYIEKPFALEAEAAHSVLDLANQKKLKVCAAHQVLFQHAGQKYGEYVPLIDEVVNIESYFSFKIVRRAGSGTISPVEQLIDILPHPVYLLLSVYDYINDEKQKETPYELRSLEVDPDGEVRALIRKGNSLAQLVVTLRGRPIESYLRVVGTNGTVNADFVLSGVYRLLGPGVSAISAVLNPFGRARQQVFGTIANLFRMVFKKHKSYAGLAELINKFYVSIEKNEPSPVSPRAITETVEICEVIGDKLLEAERAFEEKAEVTLAEIEKGLKAPDITRGTVLVTGGTGFLGKVLVKELRERGWPVRVLARRIPSARVRIPGVEYLLCDVGDRVPDEAFEDVSIVAHLAAETVGGKDEHERNTIGATRNMVEGAARHGVKKFINISSIAVHTPSAKIGGPIREDSPIDFGNLGRGPYVWAKAEAEKLVDEVAQQHSMEHRTIRLGPLVNFEKFSPPGRLGREVGPMFVAMGSRNNQISVCDVRTASNVIRYFIEQFDAAPAALNLVESPAPTRRDLVLKVKETRPYLHVFWMPGFVLKTLSLMLKGILKLLKPGKKPLDLYSAFASEKYDSTLAANIIKASKSEN